MHFHSFVFSLDKWFAVGFLPEFQRPETRGSFITLFVCYRYGSPQLSAKESGGRQFYFLMQVWG